MDKRRIIALALVISSLGCSKANADLNRNKNGTEKTVNCISYSKGKIYIGDEKNIDSIEDLDYFDLLVVDERDSTDPNMKIKDSYKIMTNSEMLEVLRLLEEYEEKNPSNWNRTIQSMRNEWIYHNMSFYLSYETASSKDVDLNNADEYRYEKKLIRN